MGDRELVCLARAFVETRRRGDEVGDIDRLPDPFLRIRVVDLASELDGRVPDTAPITLSIYVSCAKFDRTYPTAE